MKKKIPARKSPARKPVKPQKPLKKAKGKGKASTTVKKAPPKAVVKPKAKVPTVKKAPPKPNKGKAPTVKRKTSTVKKVVKSKSKVAEVPKATASPWKEQFVIRTQDGTEVDRKDDLIDALQAARLAKGRVAVYKTAPKGGKDVMMSFTGYGRWKGYEDYAVEFLN